MKQKWLDIVEIMDAFRPVPKLWLTVFLGLLLSSCSWYMNLKSPTPEQTSYITELLKTVGLLTAFYTAAAKTKWLS